MMQNDPFAAGVNLSAEEQRFWNTYLATLESPPNHPRVHASMAGDAGLADELLQLYLSGRKHAGSGLVLDYEVAGEPLPEVDNYWIVLDSQSRPSCLLKTVRVEIHRFDQVTDAVALAEGEGDGSLGHWQNAHRNFFAPHLERLGIHDLESAQVVTEYFQLVHTA